MLRLSDHPLEACVAKKLRRYIAARYNEAVKKLESLNAEDKIPGKEFSVKYKLDAATVVADYLEYLSQGIFKCDGLNSLKPGVVAALVDGRLAAIIYDYVSEAYADLKPAVILPTRKPYFVSQWLHEKILRIFSVADWRNLNTQAYCQGCSDVYIPIGVGGISGNAIAGSPVKRLIIPDSVERISWAAFKGCPIEELVLGSGVR